MITKPLGPLNKKNVTVTAAPQETQRAKVYIATETLDYVSNSVVTRKIVDKATGNVSILACDAGVDMDEKISAFDTFVLVLEGDVDIRIEHRSHHLCAGQCIIMPAHFRNLIRSTARFKLLMTVIKSGYES
jgi:mannose-6-phosphate isomerase-like protein (cupin superfamily)